MLTCSSRMNGRSTCALLTPACQRKGIKWCRQKPTNQHNIFDFMLQNPAPAVWSFKMQCSSIHTLILSLLFLCSSPSPPPHLPTFSPSILPVRSSSMETCSGTFSRWSFHAPPHQTSSRSAWSCRSFSLSSSTPASGPSPPGALAPTCPLKPPSSTQRREAQSFVSVPFSILLGEMFNADCVSGSPAGYRK